VAERQRGHQLGHRRAAVSTWNTRSAGAERGYQTRELYPTYTTDPGVDKVADLIVHFGSAMSLPKEQREVEVRLYFGDTQIRVEAENVHTGQVQKAQVKWTPTW